MPWIKRVVELVEHEAHAWTEEPCSGRRQKVVGALQSDDIRRNEALRPEQELHVFDPDAQLAEPFQRHAEVQPGARRRQLIARKRQRVGWLIEDQVVDRDVLVLLLEVGVRRDVQVSRTRQRLAKLRARAREIAAEDQIVAPLESRVGDPRQPMAERELKGAVALEVAVEAQPEQEEIGTIARAAHLYEQRRRAIRLDELVRYVLESSARRERLHRVTHLLGVVEITLLDVEVAADVLDRHASAGDDLDPVDPRIR